MQFTTTTLLALVAIASAAPSTPLRRAADTCTDPAGLPQDEWFITPSQSTDCNTDIPNYRPNSGSDDTSAMCQPLFNLGADPNGATNFTSASVATPCGGWNVTIYSTDDCSDQGVLVTGTNSAPACLVAPDGSPFTHFSSVTA